MERNDLKEIIRAAVLVRQSAATMLVTGNKNDMSNKKIVQAMKNLADHAEQTARIRAGSYMADNIQKELEQEFFEELNAARDLLVATLKEKEVKNDIN